MQGCGDLIVIRTEVPLKYFQRTPVDGLALFVPAQSIEYGGIRHSLSERIRMIITQKSPRDRPGAQRRRFRPTEITAGMQHAADVVPDGGDLPGLFSEHGDQDAERVLIKLQRVAESPPELVQHRKIVTGSRRLFGLLAELQLSQLEGRKQCLFGPLVVTHHATQLTLQGQRSDAYVRDVRAREFAADCSENLESALNKRPGCSKVLPVGLNLSQIHEKIR